MFVYQEEEKRMRDEYIAFQKQEEERQNWQKTQITQLEKTTKKRNRKDMKGEICRYCVVWAEPHLSE